MTKRRRIFTCILASIGLAFAACGGEPPQGETDGGLGDTGVDESDGQMTDDEDGTSSPDGGDEPMQPPGDMLYSTSGGGTISSDEYKLQISVGAPSSRDTADNDSYRIQVAPVSP